MTDEVTRGLQRAGITATTSFGRGLPVLLPWGLAIVDHLIDLVEASLRSAVTPGAWCSWEPNLVRDAAAYDEETGESTASDSTFAFAMDGRARVLRPDAAVDGLRRALAQPGAGRRAGFAAYPAHRDLRGACIPLNRDRAIWPLMQLNVVSGASDAGRLRDDLLEGLDGVFAALGLPVVKVDHGVWKRYARRRIDWVLAAPGAVPTVLAMAYEVGDRFRDLAGVPQDHVAWDVGLTARPVRILWELQVSARRCILPFAIAPVHVVVGSSAVSHEALASGDLRIEVVDDAAEDWWKPWEARGVPVIVARAKSGRRCLIGGESWANSSEPLDALVAAASRPVPDPVLSGRTERGPGFDVLCRDHQAGRTMAAPVLPRVHGPCKVCGEPGHTCLSADSEQIY